LIGEIDRARNPDLKFALVLGVNESIFPAAPDSPVILTNTDREELENQKITPGPNLYEQISRERFLGYIACTRASEKLAVTFSRNNANGEVLNPSAFITRLRQIFPGLPVEEFHADTNLDEVVHASKIASLIFRNQKPETRNQNWNELLEIPAIAALSGSLGALREPNAAENLSPTLAGKIYGAVLRTSSAGWKNLPRVRSNFLSIPACAPKNGKFLNSTRASAAVSSTKS
jgi:ATP-dependent helicase/nuclease subunit B